MAQVGRTSKLCSNRLSRRALLGTSLLGTLFLAACGDETSDRQFAGGPLTPGSQSPPNPTSVSPLGGSPTAAPTRMPIGDLLKPRGVSAFAVIARPNRVSMVNIESGASSEVWADPGRVAWEVAPTALADKLALLTAPSEVTSRWSVDFVESDGTSIGTVELGRHSGTPGGSPDAVAGGRGGVAWVGESQSVAVAIPSGGLQQIYQDGSRIKLLSAAEAKRPSAVAVTVGGGAIAYVDQPSGSEGTGIYASSMKAKPIDPIVVLPPDRTGNRMARNVAWIGSTGRLTTIIEREELGNPQGDLFYIDSRTGKPVLAWSSPAGRVNWSVESFTVSDDAQVVAFLTNPSDAQVHRSSSVWMMQIDGPAIERFDLPLELKHSRLAFSPEGLAVSGTVRSNASVEVSGAVYVVTPTGAVVERYLESHVASPVASPAASPVASIGASPVASPKASQVASPKASPVTSPKASPVASPSASPVASPKASPSSTGTTVGD